MILTESTFTYQRVYIHLYQISAYEQNENTSLLYHLPLDNETKHNTLYNRKIILFKGPEELKEAMQGKTMKDQMITGLIQYPSVNIYSGSSSMSSLFFYQIEKV